MRLWKMQLENIGVITHGAKKLHGMDIRMRKCS
jgi:hypothetical protein